VPKSRSQRKGCGCARDTGPVCAAEFANLCSTFGKDDRKKGLIINGRGNKTDDQLQPYGLHGC
jgi:hypothetical protein